ncbi:MAG: hypothetical protein KGI38_03365 [Thaumarchaeota archaeon]|nr:hypothetical protein [Nitrososphaerota archaeon]
MNQVSHSLTDEFVELVSRARRTITIGLSDENITTHVVSGLIATSNLQAEVELYVKLDDWGSRQTGEWEKMLAKGVQVFWDPDLNRNIATIDGIRYSLEESGARCIESRGFNFRKTGFFGVILGKLESGQRLAGGRGFHFLMIIEQGGKRYPMFVTRDRLFSHLRAGDVLRVAYLSIVGDRTFSGNSPPAEVFLEALSIEQIERHRDNKNLVWSSAKDVIDNLLAETVVQPLKREKKKDAWMEATRIKISSDLRKRMIYIDADDERYLYAKIRERAGPGFR